MKKLILLVISLLLLNAAIVGLLPPDLYAAIAMPILLVYLTGAFVRKTWMTSLVARQELGRNPSKADRHPLVSIIVPCYNEEKVIVKTLDSLRKLNYSNYEIIVVDDGSTDNTFEVAIKDVKAGWENGDFTTIMIMRQDNGGKASAINYGVSVADGKYILCVDADSTLDPDGLTYAVSILNDDPRVCAVAGHVEVANKKGLLSKCQDYEYQVGLNFTREGLAHYGVVPVVPGPVGLFRKDVLKELGGFRDDRNLMAEDCELALRISTTEYVVATEPRLRSFTQAPNSIRDLLRQRYRWNRGVLQAIELNVADMLSSRRKAKLLAVHMLFESYGVMVLNLAMVLMFSLQYVKYGRAQFLDVWVAGLLLSELIITALVVRERKRKAGSFLIALWSQFSYNGMMMFWRAFSFVDEMLARPISWDKLNRR